MYKNTKNILEKLDSLYNVLDLMENGIISRFYYNKVKKEINDLLEELQKITK